MTTNFESNQFHLSEEEMKRLEKWFGYGAFREADIVFFGNEEGLGGYPIEAVRARTRVYGNNSDTWLDKNWENGYWDETGDTGYNLVGEVTNEIRAEKGLVPHNIKEGNPNSTMLDFQARLLLALEKPEYDWFALKRGKRNEETTDKTDITDKWKEKYDRIQTLYDKDHKIKAALMDWRPLPRQNESTWPYQLNQKEYLKAFKPGKRYAKKIQVAIKSDNLDGLNEYGKMVVTRTKLLKQVIEQFDFPVLVASGDPDAKEILFKLIFAEKGITFEEKTLSNGKRYKKAVVHVGNRELTILLSLFFNYRSNCLGRDGLKGLYEEELSPLFKDI
ncbi:hypothetical protein [Exiguobacterium sp. s26]|uniref:hypothetical protein n=1 Tax=Exiguobacterium sp. s26 TaxID=2751231 RepID=UPI001BEBB620|nr:hypothetical protein [Exiguobacterium sp. s26]